MCISRFTVAGVALVIVFGCALPTRAGTPTVATQTLLDTHPGMRAMFDGERMIALYGVPFATDNDPQTTTDDFVDAFLAEHGDALGVDNVDLVLRDKLNIREDKFTVYTYTQNLEGLPVHATMVKIPVLLGGPERIGYIGIRLFQAPETPLPADVLTESEAIDVVAQSPGYGHLGSFTEPEKVIFHAWDEALHRVWRFAGHDNDESYRFFVHTNGVSCWGSTISSFKPTCPVR